MQRNQHLADANILDLVGLADAAPAIRGAFLKEAAGVVMGRVAANLARDLPTEALRREFDDILQHPENAERRAAFLAAHAPDLERRVQRAVAALKKDIRAAAKEIGR